MVDGTNDIENYFIYQLMSNVQLQESKTFDSQIFMHFCTQNNDVSLAKEFQKHLSKENRKHGVINQEKFIKRSSKRKWTDREYHVQDNAGVAHKYMKMHCNTNQFPKLPFCGPHPKPHRARRVTKHCHLIFDPKLDHVICAIYRIPCACVVYTSMIEQLCISGILSRKQGRYQPVTHCT